jgi:two-component system, NarL family, response regulator
VINVLCVDDHRLMREGITFILGMHPDVRVVAEASNGEEAVAMYERFRPDVTLMDLQLPRLNGLEATRAIRKINPAARIVVLTMYQGDEDIYRAIQAGAVGYVLKDSLSGELLRVIRAVHRGENAVPPDIAAKLALRPAQTALTAREVQVLELLRTGMRNRDIADALRITEETARTHIKNIFGKLNVHDRTAALAEAVRRGLVHIDP